MAQLPQIPGESVADYLDRLRWWNNPTALWQKELKKKELQRIALMPIQGSKTRPERVARTLEQLRAEGITSLEDLTKSSGKPSKKSIWVPGGDLARGAITGRGTATEDLILQMLKEKDINPTAAETLKRIKLASKSDRFKKRLTERRERTQGKIAAEHSKMYERSLPPGADIESIPKKVGGGVEFGSITTKQHLGIPKSTAEALAKLGVATPMMEKSGWTPHTQILPTRGGTYPTDKLGAIQQLVDEVVANPDRPLSPQQARIAAAIALTPEGGNIGRTMYDTQIDVRQRTQEWPKRDDLNRIIYSDKIDPVTGKKKPEYTSVFKEAGDWGRTQKGHRINPLAKAEAPLAFGAKVPIADLDSEMGGLGRSPAKTKQAKALADEKMWRQSMKGDPLAIERMLAGQPMWTRFGKPRPGDLEATYPTTPKSPQTGPQQGFLVRDFAGTKDAPKPGRSLSQILTAAATADETMAGGKKYKKMLPKVNKLLQRMGMPGSMLALLAALGIGVGAGSQGEA